MKVVEMPGKEHKDSKPPVANKSLSTIHDHSKAAAYLAELTEKIKAEYGQDTLDIRIL